MGQGSGVLSVKGGEATSIADLVKGRGVNRGSRYATFGIQQIVTRALGKLEAFFGRRIEAAKASGQIGADIHTEGAARSLVALTVGFRVLARGARDAEALRSIKGAALRIIGVTDTTRI
ncbi:hypothetical protein NBRC116599_31730 [Aquicoccus sp. SU-CL01552]